MSTLLAIRQHPCSLRLYLYHTGLVIVSGNNQSGVTGTRLRSPFVVRVDDVNNYALPGKRVIFSVVSGGGHLSTTIARTDSRGEAQAFLTLGDIPGINSVEVSVRDVLPVRFRATAVGIVEKLVISSGADQIGFPNKRLAAPLVVQAVDRDGYSVSSCEGRIQGYSRQWVCFTGLDVDR